MLGDGVDGAAALDRGYILSNGGGGQVELPADGRLVDRGRRHYPGSRAPAATRPPVPNRTVPPCMLVVLKTGMASEKLR